MIRARTYRTLDLDAVHIGMATADAVLLEANARGASRVVIVGSTSVLKNTAVQDQIEYQLGARLVGVFSDCVEHVPRRAVLALVQFLRETKADLIVTIGGGTPMDTVKVALVCLAQDVDQPEDMGQHAVSVSDTGERIVPDIVDPPLRQIIVPTTLSGAEFSDLAGCVDEEAQVKQLFTAPKIGGSSVILDPSLTLKTPMNLWLSTGVRAMDHAVETICSSAPEAIADAGALHSLRLLSGALPRTVEEPDNLPARLDCQTAVWLACAGLNRTPYGASHGIGHQLGAVANVPHGFTSCVMLPHVMRFNLAETQQRQAWIADAFGQPDRPAHECVAAMVRQLGMPTRLRDVGVEKHHFDAIAEGSLLNAFVRANIGPITKKSQILDLLEAAY